MLTVQNKVTKWLSIPDKSSSSPTNKDIVMQDKSVNNPSVAANPSPAKGSDENFYSCKIQLEAVAPLYQEFIILSLPSVANLQILLGALRRGGFPRQ